MPREAKLPPRVGATALRGKPKHSFKAERRLKMVESAEKERINSEIENFTKQLCVVCYQCTNNLNWTQVQLHLYLHLIDCFFGHLMYRVDLLANGGVGSEHTQGLLKQLLPPQAEGDDTEQQLDDTILSLVLADGAIDKAWSLVSCYPSM